MIDRRANANQARWSRMRGPWGFTLVELLVVVAVISLLATLLVPALGRARSLGRSAVCQSNLRQIWELFHNTGNSMQMPGPQGWLSFVTEHGSGALARCPEDSFEAVSELSLAEVYIVQNRALHYPLMDFIQNPGQAGSEHQLELFTRGPNQYEIWIGNYTNTSALSASDADGAFFLHLDKNAVIEPIWAPGCVSCGSEHWICYGPNIGTANWEADIVLRLTGRDYRTVDPPFNVMGAPCSYGMNIDVKPFGGRGGQLLLLDYRKTVANPVADTVGGEMQYLDPSRHLGRVNAVFVSGSVRGRWPDEVDPSAPLWK